MDGGYSEGHSEGHSEMLLDVKQQHNVEKPGKHSMISAIFVLVHNAIGAGILLFPYAFWAFGGPEEAVMAQLVSIVCIKYRYYATTKSILWTSFLLLLLSNIACAKQMHFQP